MNLALYILLTADALRNRRLCDPQRRRYWLVKGGRFWGVPDTILSKMIFAAV